MFPSFDRGDRRLVDQLPLRLCYEQRRSRGILHTGRLGGRRVVLDELKSTAPFYSAKAKGLAGDTSALPNMADCCDRNDWLLPNDLVLARRAALERRRNHGADSNLLHPWPVALWVNFQRNLFVLRSVS